MSLGQRVVAAVRRAGRLPRRHRRLRAGGRGRQGAYRQAAASGHQDDQVGVLFKKVAAVCVLRRVLVHRIASFNTSFDQI